MNWIRQWREKKAGDFPRKLSNIVKELEAEAATIARLYEEGERKAEIERLRWEEQRRESERREQERRRLKAEEDSHSDLSRIIEEWARTKRIEQFFSEAEQRSLELASEERIILQERLKMAREMIGSTDVLKWFAQWKTPEEKLREEQEARKRWL